MPIPDYETLMLPVLREAANREVHVRDLIARLADQYHLTDAEREEMIPSGRTPLFANRVHWAKTYLKQAGLIDQPSRGMVRLTARGQELLAAAPAAISRGLLLQYEEFRQFLNRRNVGDAVEVQGSVNNDDVAASALSPEEQIGDASETLEATLATDLLAKVRDLTPQGFERLVIELLVGMGYGGSRPEAARALGRSGDDGVDGVIDEDALGLDRIYLQAKRWQPGKSVGPAEVRDFFGSLDLKKATKGLFVTTSTFTDAARRTAEQLGKRIVLVDGEQLARLMIRYSVGCRLHQTIELKRLDDDFFDGLA